MNLAAACAASSAEQYSPGIGRCAFLSLSYTRAWNGFSVLGFALITPLKPVVPLDVRSFCSTTSISSSATGKAISRVSPATGQSRYHRYLDFGLDKDVDTWSSDWARPRYLAKIPVWVPSAPTITLLGAAGWP